MTETQTKKPRTWTKGAIEKKFSGLRKQSQIRRQDERLLLGSMSNVLEFTPDGAFSQVDDHSVDSLRRALARARMKQSVLVVSLPTTSGKSLVIVVDEPTLMGVSFAASDELAISQTVDYLKKQQQAAGR